MNRFTRSLSILLHADTNCNYLALVRSIGVNPPLAACLRRSPFVSPTSRVLCRGSEQRLPRRALCGQCPRASGIKSRAKRDEKDGWGGNGEPRTPETGQTSLCGKVHNSALAELIDLYAHFRAFPCE